MFKQGVVDAMFVFLKELLFPSFCLSCHHPGTYICLSCQKKIKPLNEDICAYCRRKSYFGLTHPICKRAHGIDGLKSMFYYEGVIRVCIKQIKYRLVTQSIKELFSIIPYQQKEQLLLYKKLANDWLFIPVPLHPVRFNKRGFNQAEKLGIFFAESLSMPLQTNTVKRIKNTIPQAEIKDKKKRLENLKNAFAINKKQDIRGKNIIIFDDVFTSGATIFEIAKLLKRNGAEKVMALTLAR